MRKIKRLPREEARVNDDGLPLDGLPVDGDVEAHGMQVAPDDFAPRLPGTGGDAARRPIGSGELDENDVEGHIGRPGGEGLGQRLPGTGGDRVRRPVGSGELDEHDVEGHRGS